MAFLCRWAVRVFAAIGFVAALVLALLFAAWLLSRDRIEESNERVLGELERSLSPERYAPRKVGDLRASDAESLVVEK